MRVLPRLSSSRPPFASLLATLLVMALMLTSPLAVTAQDEAQGTGHERLLDITFPLSGPNSYVDTFDAPRSGGRTHRATDLMADKLVHVHAAMGGTVCHFKGEGDSNISLSGYMLEICGDDGFEYSYIHLNNDTPGTDDGMGGNEWAFAPGIEKGVRVERGQWIGYVGDSGNAEHVAHLHFSIYDENQAEEEGKINPFRSLVAAQDRGDVPDPPADPNDPDAVDDTPQEPEDAEGGSTGQEPVAEDPQPTPEPEPAPADGAQVDRVAGSTRIGTAIALSQRAWPNGNSRGLIIVPAGSHSEALASAALAGHIASPILLADGDGLSQEARDEIQRLDPISAYIVGTPEQLSASIETELDSLGVQFSARISVDDRYALSAALLEELASYPDAPVMDQVILALGDAPEASRAWPDALSASALSSHARIPVLLTEGDRLPDAVADVLTRVRPQEILVVGGTAAVSDQVAEEAAAVAGNATVTRLAGESRYDTSVAVAQAGRDAGLASGEVLVATGLNYPDALAAGPAATRLRAPLVLVHGTTTDGSPASIQWIAELGLQATIVGGPGVVTDEVAAALAR